MSLARPATPAGSRQSAANQLGVVIACVVAFNLACYALGRAAGGSFLYHHNGQAQRVDAISVVIMTVGPLLVALVAVGAAARRWPKTIPVARVLAVVAAVGSIFAMPVPVDFDVTSTVSLAVMHLAAGAAALAWLQTIERGLAT